MCGSLFLVTPIPPKFPQVCQPGRLPNPYTVGSGRSRFRRSWTTKQHEGQWGDQGDHRGFDLQQLPQQILWGMLVHVQENGELQELLDFGDVQARSGGSESNGGQTVTVTSVGQEQPQFFGWEQLHRFEIEPPASFFGASFRAPKIPITWDSFAETPETPETPFFLLVLNFRTA